MPNLMTLAPVAIKFCTLAYQLEQIETDSSQDAATKRANALAVLPQIESLVDSAAGLPAGAVEKYLTPAALALIYDGAVFAEAKIAAGHV